MLGELCVQLPVIVPSVLTCPCILSPLDKFNQLNLPSASCEILFCINKYSESIFASGYLSLFKTTSSTCGLPSGVNTFGFQSYLSSQPICNMMTTIRIKNNSFIFITGYSFFIPTSSIISSWYEVF